MQGLCKFYFDYDYNNYNALVHMKHAIGWRKELQIFHKI